MLLKYIGTLNFTINTGFGTVELTTGTIIQLSAQQHKYLKGQYASLFEDVVRLGLEPSATPGTPDLIAINDSGVSSTDNITNFDVVTITISSVVNADYYQISTDDGTNWSAKQSLTSFDLTLVEGTYTVVARSGNNAGVSAKSAALTLVIDRTEPTLESVVRDSNTQITVTLSELAATASITKANAGGFTVFETGTPATVYVVSAIAPGITNDLVVLTVSDMTASALTGVTITYVAGGNGTVSDLAGNLLEIDSVGVATGAF